MKTKCTCAFPCGGTERGCPSSGAPFERVDTPEFRRQVAERFVFDDCKIGPRTAGGSTVGGPVIMRRTRGFTDTEWYKFAAGLCQALNTAAGDRLLRMLADAQLFPIVQRDFNERGEIIRKYREGIELTEVFGVTSAVPVERTELRITFCTDGARQEFIKKLAEAVKARDDEQA